MFNYIKKDSVGDLMPDIPKIVTHAIILVLALVLIFGSFGTIGAGERGVKTRFKAAVGMVPQGLYFKAPFIESVEKMDVRTQSLITTPDQPLMAASNDLQDTRLSVVVNYHIDPSQVVDIYVQYGTAERYYNQVVEPLIIATIKATASQYTAADQIQKRTEMSAKAQEALVTAFEGKNVAIEKTDITNIQFSEAFTQAIETKVTAVQNAEAAKNKLAQVQYEADQRIAQAKGEAEAIRIQSQAIESSGGKNYVLLQWIKAWEAGGAKVPTFIGGEDTGNFLLNLGGLQ